MLRLMQRICWNTRGWRMPSGSTNENGFPGENGFAHEEWNFQISDTWNSFVFPYIYSVPQQRRLDEHGGQFDIGFFTRYQESNRWLFIGIHHHAELILDEEYSRIFESFMESGIFDRRADELLAVTDKFETREAALKEVTDAFTVPYIRIKTRRSDIEVFSQPIPIEKPSNNRFTRFTYVDEFPCAAHNEEQQHSALAEDGYYRESSSYLKKIIPKHNKLSNDFCRWLNERGVVVRQEENCIDVLFKINRTRYIAELKVVREVGTTKAVREALGQLLEYNYYPGRDINEEWMIILDQEPARADQDYIDNLIGQLQLPLRIGWQTGNGFEFYPEWKVNGVR